MGGRSSFSSRWLAAALLFFAVRLAAAPHFASEAELVGRVVDLMDRRLAVMPEVAAIKFQQQKPIADPAREREVIEQSVADARAMQLDGEAARAFFSVQILMARAIQEQLFERWQAGTVKPPAARDLVKYLRPELDALGRQLLPAVYLASPALVTTPAAGLEGRLASLRRHAGVTDAHLGELARALGALRLTAGPSWATIQRVGVLRVGTTGDYAPFSDDAAGTLRGSDITLAESLAQAWGVSVVFVRTSWPTLMADLAAHRFDLGASGVSITPERRKVADFSVPYYFDGKTPIARREQAARFASLEQIDQPGVRVIVNPGGTNERFVRENIKRATIVLHPDNRTIFAEILAGRADVMITDGIEVRLQTGRHPELQGTMREPFTRTGKALLLPLQSDLTARVDTWLGAQLERGQIAKQLEQAVGAAPAPTPVPSR
ncbi:MAG: gamma subclass chorismate mutase AroQ [Verrucomicrobiota bacterium]